MCIYSQLKSCSASEVAAMIEGVLHHLTSAEIDRNYVDTHGASVVGFAFADLLGFRLLPRLKTRAPGGLHAGAAPAAVRPGAHQHPAATARPWRPRLGGAAHRYRPARPDAAVLSNVNPYGRFTLDMDTHLDLDRVPATAG